MPKRKKLKKKKINKETKTYQLKELRRLKRKALALWKEVVKKRAGYKCEACGRKEMIQAHHIETERTHPFLRLDPRNGIACDPRCHKFGANSFHQSPIFTYKFLKEKRPDDLEYLLNFDASKFDPKVLETKEYYEKIILSLDSELAGS